MSNLCSDRHYAFVALTKVPADGSPAVTKGDFSERFMNFYARRAAVWILTDVNVELAWLSSK